MYNFSFRRSVALVLIASALIYPALWPAPALSSEPRGRPNRLIHEKSPYLQQHAYNPVDWYPWGEEAFQKARKENKPIFLSIGYSTCHWCHVMENEIFSDPKLAALMNKFFVSIKVDREERPDVDKIYMTAVVAMTGSGGWPLSVWLTPDLKPFYGGTYFPPEARGGRPGFGDVLRQIAKVWREEPGKVRSAGNDLTDIIKANMTAAGRKGPLTDAAFKKALSAFDRSYDPAQGGFGGAPKFPMPVNHQLLLRLNARTKDSKAMDMSLHTLRQMAKGGIYDQVGGGFHRYSTDAAWRVPHFEKMLYDNAQIAVNYLEAYQLTREEDFARVARETLEYVLRDMTHPEGGFYSAEDADSLAPEPADQVPARGRARKSEGAFYLWKKEEIVKLLGKRTGELFSYRYGVGPSGNAASDPQGEFKGRNILYIAHSLGETAKKFRISEKETEKTLRKARQALFDARVKRPRPHLDDKILVSWNGLMISAFARAAQVLNEPGYASAGERAARFIRSKLYNVKATTLKRRWRDGESRIPGIADDYAFLAQGLLDLYEATFDTAWLEWAIELTETQNRLFYDDRDGGFYMTAPGHDKSLLVRTKEDVDNVEPAAGSIATLNLLRLAQFTDRGAFRQAAEKTLASFAERMNKQPRALPQMLSALDYYLSKPKQIIIAGEPSAPETGKMLQEVHRRFIPNKILMVVNGGKNREFLARQLPFLKGVVPLKAPATAYVCIDYGCQLPTSDLATLTRILDGRQSGQGR